jgi:phenol 2-monooxygenase (NADPH)
LKGYRFPFELTLSQAEIEGILREAMQESGVHTEQPVVPTSLVISQDVADEYPIKVTLAQLNPQTSELDSDEKSWEHVHAKYVVGADGMLVFYGSSCCKFYS